MDAWWGYMAQRLYRGNTHTRAFHGQSGEQNDVHKLFSLLQSSKLIFQASKNHTNFYVDTRNQEQPILLGIGRKAFVGLK